MSLLETRYLNGYTFKLFDEDEYGFVVEVWKDDEKLGTEYVTCRGANCEPSDEDLLNLL